MGDMGGGTFVTITLIINFRESVQKRVMMKIFPLMSGWGGVKSSADHLYLTTAQLGGIGLQEFAHICLYNVIKAFLGPTASA